MTDEPIRILLDTNLIEAGGREISTYQGISGYPTPTHVWHWSDEIPSDPVRAKEIKSFWGIIKQREKSNRIKFYSSRIFFFEAMERPLIGSRGLGYNKKLDITHLDDNIFTISYFGNTQEERKIRLRHQILNSKNDRLNFLLKHFGNKQSQDCAHLVCAENGKMEYFLTMDRKFVRTFLSRNLITKSSVKVMCPSEFCELHAIPEVEQIRERTFGRHDYQGVQLNTAEWLDYKNQNKFK